MRAIFASWGLAGAPPAGAGCGGDGAQLVSRWQLEREARPTTQVTLPGNLEAQVGRTAGRYRLHARVEVREAWRGRELSLTVPAFDGVVDARADGGDVPAAGLEAPRRHRQPGPHRFTVPGAATADGVVDLELVVQHRWWGSARFGAAPRLTPAGESDPLTWMVWIFTLVVPAGALVALFQIGMTSTTVYLTDRRRRPYLLFGIQALAAQAYPLHVLGFSQLVFGTWDVCVLAVLLTLAICVSIYFTHAFFALPRPSPWFARGAALVIVVPLAFPGPFDYTRIAGPITVAYLTLLATYQVVVCARLYLRGRDRRSAGYLLLSWVGLALACGPDFVAFADLGDPARGLRTANVGLGLFAFWLSLLFSQRHIGSMAEADERGDELRERVRQLERQGSEIQQLNVELRRQLSDKSAQIYAALAIAKEQTAVAPKLAAGDVIEQRYRIERALGAGGMGEVFEVTRLLDGRRFALKLTHEVSGVALARLAREAQVALSVTHENVVQVVDVDVSTSGFLYIVMELVDGAPLAVQPGAHDLAWTTEVLVQVARGLVALHQAGVVHRDLKPSNVLVTEATHGGLRVKITDFGISLGQDALAEAVEHSRTLRVGSSGDVARQGPGVDATISDAGGDRQAKDTRVLAPSPSPAPPPPAPPEDPGVTGATLEVPAPPLVPAFATPRGSSQPSTPGSPLTGTGLLPGTPAYIAPELLHGRSRISPAADVFAFGVMAYELLTGRRPFLEPPVLALLAGRTVRWPAPLVETDAQLQRELAAVVDECLAQTPERRPTSAELARRLEEVARARGSPAA